MSVQVEEDGEEAGDGEVLSDCVLMLPGEEGLGEVLGEGEVEHLLQDWRQKPDIQLWLHWPQAACWAQV